MILKTISDDLGKSGTGKLVCGLFLEFDRGQHLLETLAGCEDHASIGDAAGGHILGLRRAFARNADTATPRTIKMASMSVIGIQSKAGASVIGKAGIATVGRAGGKVGMGASRDSSSSRCSPSSSPLLSGTMLSGTDAE